MKSEGRLLDVVMNLGFKCSLLDISCLERTIGEEVVLVQPMELLTAAMVKL